MDNAERQACVLLLDSLQSVQERAHYLRQHEFWAELAESMPAAEAAELLLQHKLYRDAARRLQAAGEEHGRCALLYLKALLESPQSNRADNSSLQLDAAVQEVLRTAEHAECPASVRGHILLTLAETGRAMADAITLLKSALECFCAKSGGNVFGVLYCLGALRRSGDSKCSITDTLAASVLEACKSVLGMKHKTWLEALGTAEMEPCRTFFGIAQLEGSSIVPDVLNHRFVALLHRSNLKTTADQMARIHPYVHVPSPCAHMHGHMRMRAHTHTQCMHARTHARTHACTHTHLHTHLHTCTGEDRLGGSAPGAAARNSRTMCKLPHRPHVAAQAGTLSALSRLQLAGRACRQSKSASHRQGTIARDPERAARAG